MFDRINRIYRITLSILLCLLCLLWPSHNGLLNRYGSGCPGTGLQPARKRVARVRPAFPPAADRLLTCRNWIALELVLSRLRVRGAAKRSRRLNEDSIHLSVEVSMLRRAEGRQQLAHT